MNPRVTLVLVLAALGLGGYLLLSGPRGRGVAVRTADGGQATSFTPVVPDQVSVIELIRSNDVVRVERAGSGWTMRLPVPYAAQGTAVDAFTVAVGKLQPSGWLTAAQVAANGPDAAKAFGLDSSATTLKLETSAGPVILKLGGLAPLGGQFYFQRVGDDGVFTADAKFLGALPETAAAWRDRGLFDLGDAAPDRLELRGKTAFEAVKDAATGAWRLVKPLAARADGERLDALLHTLRTVRVAQFVNDAPAADPELYGVQPPEAELVAGRGSDTLAHLQFGRSPTNMPGGVYVRRMSRTNVVLVPAAAAFVLRGPLADFRDRRLLPLLTDSTRIEFTTSAEKAVLERTGTHWNIVAPIKTPADPELMGFFFSQLAASVITDFPNDVVADYGRYGLEKPFRSYGFSRGTNPPFQFQFGARSGEEHIFVRRLDEPGVYTVRLTDMLQLPETAAQLRDLRFASSNVVKVVVSQKGNSRTLERGADGLWAVTAGSAGNPFSPAVEETLHRLGQMQTTRFAVRDEQMFTRLPSFAELAHEVMLTLAPGGAVKTLRLRFVSDLGAAAIALADVDGEAAPLRVEVPGPLFRDIRRDLSAW